MELRPYRPADCPALLELFRQSVHRAAAGEYTPAQLAAWAPEVPCYRGDTGGLRALPAPDPAPQDAVRAGRA